MRILSFEFDESEAARGLEVFRQFGEEYINGYLKPWMYEIEAAVMVSALPKENSGDYRPLGVGNVESRLFTAQAVRNIRKEAYEAFWPIQVAVATPAGPQKLILAVRLHLDSHPDHALIKMDFANAYSEFCRLAGLRAVAAQQNKISDLAPHVHTDLAARGELIGLGGERCETGGYQGKLTTGLIFCLALQPHLEWAKKKINEKIKEANGGGFLNRKDEGMVMANMDDSYIVGPIEIILDVFAELKPRVLKDLQLKLNEKKSAVYARGEYLLHTRETIKKHRKSVCRDLPIACLSSEDPETVKEGEGVGFLLVGVGVGDEKFEKETLSSKVS